MLRLIILRLLESYFRHRWLYLAPIVMMACVSVQYIRTQPASYIVRSTMYVQNDVLLSSLTALGSDGFGWSTPAQATVNEMYQLLNAGAFLRAIVAQTDLEIKMTQGPDAINRTLAEARESIWVQTLGDNLMLIGVSHEMPRIAHQLALATVDTYIQWKINLNRDESVAAQAFFSDLIDTYYADVEPARVALATYVQEHPKPLRGERSEEEHAEIARLQAAVDSAEARLRHAEDQEENARLALVQTESTVRQTYFVVDAPQRPTVPERSKKDMALNIGLFVLAGAVISIVGIAGGALLDPTFRFPVDVRYGLNLPVLAIVAASPIGITTDRGEQSETVISETVINAAGATARVNNSAPPATSPAISRPLGNGAANAEATAHMRQEVTVNGTVATNGNAKRYPFQRRVLG